MLSRWLNIAGSVHLDASAKGFDKVKLAPRKKMVTMLLFVTIAISAQKAEGHRRVSPVSNQKFI